MTTVTAEEKLEIEDLQGIIVRGYLTLHHAQYVLLNIPGSNAAGARSWLRKIAGEITRGNEKPEQRSFNIAFTSEGLVALGLDPQALESFPRQMTEGMTQKNRSRILGDLGDSSPESWVWGNDRGGVNEVHLLLMLCAISKNELDEFYTRLREGYLGEGLLEIRKLETFVPTEPKEHFGFTDGIAQPLIRGLPKADNSPPENVIAAGEFILGYRNEYKEIPYSPCVETAKDPLNILPLDPSLLKKDLGRNGSYFVFRQLSQDVHAFWNYMNEATKSPEGVENPFERVKLASKMVGRWPSGAPLVLSPDKDDTAFANRDDFGYAAADPHGLKCPVGSHLRRVNPRDSMVPGPEESIAVSRRHRILRRGRLFGAPVAASMDPADILRTPPDNQERGVYFGCLNTDIERQFEFVQQTWCNSRKFEGLYDDSDPIIGGLGEGETGTFTVPGCPVRQRHTGLPRFVKVLGGAYFFLPGIKALRYIASVQN